MADNGLLPRDVAALARGIEKGARALGAASPAGLRTLSLGDIELGVGLNALISAASVARGLVAVEHGDTRDMVQDLDWVLTMNRARALNFSTNPELYDAAL